MSEITLEIKGRPWKFVLVTDKRYDKLHNKNGEDSVAVTMQGLYEVHFKKSCWDLITIRHEIGHILYNMSLTGSAENTPEQVQEIYCEIIGHHWSDIGIWTDRVAEKFFQES